ncbi:TetR/AcrR family transcriptional regulator [Rhodococcus sovatensis]|uniref:TetR/AcrR family transcriptional regulator C-terminal domain-containing protein n=1 Tax=Rhodococcus sovatensis TaxID=1805840 RepID=A0ABZ2PRR3_9NOCA
MVDGKDVRSGGKRAYRTGMTSRTIVDAAVALTRQHGLEAWTTRTLAASLDTSLSVLAHHIGDRQALSAAVVDRVAGSISVPSPDLSWRSWLTELFTSLREAFESHPGVAQWTLLHGPVTDAIAPVVDAAVTVLLDAGFGDDAARAYAVVFTVCVSQIALGDARRTTNAGHGAMLYGLPPAGERGRGLDAMVEMIAGFSRSDHYAYTLECALDGIDAQRARR